MMLLKNSRNLTNCFTNLSIRTAVKNLVTKNTDKLKEFQSNYVSENNEITSEELFMKKSIEGWANTFGTLSGKPNHDNLDEKIYEDDKDEIDEFEKPYRRLDTKFRKHDPDWYGKKIEKLGKEGLVYEALQVLEHEMLTEDRVRPNAYVFNTLIGILGRVGYTKKAFQLFNRMKKFGIHPDDPTYTGLFNSCSNSPWLEDGRKRADHLRMLMKEQNVEVNIITYQAMIKAYARLGDMKTAFSLADEALEKKLKLSGETFSFLMMACISDKEAGFGLSIKLWRLMRKKKLKFTTFNYNLLLRAARDCGIGNEHICHDLFNNLKFNQAESTGNKLLTSPTKNKQMNDVDHSHPTHSSIMENKINQNETIEIYSPSQQQTIENSNLNTEKSPNVISSDRNVSSLTNIPNVLNPNFVKTVNPTVIGINNPTTSVDRLMLFGGVRGFLSHLKKDGCQPNIKTFAFFLDLTPSDKENDDELLLSMEEYGIKPDLSFCNALIRKKNLRGDFKDAKNVLDMMTSLDLQPNHKTFGCLAMGCSSESRGMKLLQGMLDLKLVPNIEICDILLFQSRLNFKYKLKILQFMKDHRIRPNVKFLEKLEKSIEIAKSHILEYEKGRRVKGDDEVELEKVKNFQEQFEKFILNYKSWLQSMPLEPQVHPWTPYDQPTPKIDET